MSLVSNIISVGYKATNLYRGKEVEIKIVGGLICMAAGVVAACSETLKAEKVLEEAKEKMNVIHEASEVCTEEEYTSDDEKKDKVEVVIQTGAKLVKTYAPAICLLSLGALSILSGYKVLNGKLIGVTAAYKSLDEAFKVYRQRVRDDVGVEKDCEYRYGVKAEKIKVLNDKNKLVVKEEAVADPFAQNGVGSCYARFIEHIPGREHVTENPYELRQFLINTMESANRLLVMRKKLYLNDVYNMLGIEETEAGHEVGWVYDPDNPQHHGDNRIDFNLLSPVNHRFMACCESVAIVDFNVDGIISNLVYARRV